MAILNQIVNNSTGLISLASKKLLELMDLQNKNQFEIILYPANMPKATDIASNVRQKASMINENIVTRVYIQTIAINLPSLKFGEKDIIKYVEKIEKPTESTFTFIEDDKSTVMNFIKSWQDQVYYFDKIKNTYVFRDDQWAARKNAKVLLHSGLGLPSPIWFSLYNLCPAGIESLTFGQGDEEYLTITLPCSVDRADLGGLSMGGSFTL